MTPGQDDAQRALRESDERYRAFVANSSEAIWRFELEEPVPVDLDPDEQIARFYRFGYLAECNDLTAAMYGFAAADELVGVRLGDMLVQEDPANVAFLRAFIESGYRLIGAESRELDRDGNEKHFVNNLIGIVENGVVLRAWGTQRDITEQRVVERERSALVARLEFVADLTAVLGSSLDYDETLASIATAAVPRFADACFIDMLNASGDMERRASRQTDPGAEFHGSFTVPLTARGRTIGALTFALADPNRTFAEEDVHLAEDLGRRAGLALDNARLYHELEQANRAKDEFLAMLSHELRTPMTAMLGWSTMLHTGALDASGARTAAEAIMQATRAQAHLIDDLLDISRIVSGKMHLSLKPLRLADAIDAAAETVRPAAEAKGITLQIEHRDDVRLQGDPERLQQVFWNLLSNAVKFTSRNGRVSVELRRDPDSARAIVRDTGEGIDGALLPFIFERFRQGNSGANRKVGGLGLGLSIARNLVELHGGTLTASSDGREHGAEFVVSLPVAADTREDTKLLDARPALRPLDGLSLLIVEDDHGTRTMLEVALRQFGASVASAANAGEAFERLAAGHYDLLVSDIGLPGEDGCAMLTRIRATRNGVRAIALTAYASPTERDRALAAGFQLWIAKPVDPAVLAEEIRRVVLLGRVGS